ncbi:hypothetical protein XAC3093 [Xanthomonas citri pv. citri str. 306]|uniref:Uncharacterized protein n=3 Tax=Gammaproteobacteria TaxID=1236 RepID=A0AAI7ZH56_XANAC|nr:hypothetical protein XAC3093 [Xanthomonas citri pv. citri str. 306]
MHSERCAALPGRRTCAGSGTDSLRDRSLIDAADACEQAPSNKASPVRLSRDMGIFCRARWDGWTTGQPEVAPLSMKRASAANGVNRMEVFFGTPALAGAMRPTSRYKRLALKPFFHRQKMARSAG